jgi:hypothetical protein
MPVAEDKAGRLERLNTRVSGSICNRSQKFSQINPIERLGGQCVAAGGVFCGEPASLKARIDGAAFGA